MADRIELWPVDRLEPYEKNARTHDEAQVKQIAASINEFGFLNPILVDENDGILAGHGRLLAAKDLGMADVPVVVLTHLTPEQKRAYVIADNQIALNAGWDLDTLREEIVALSLADFDVSLTGLEDWRISNLLGTTDEEEEHDDDGGNGERENECPACGHRWA
jgi:ParB-like chromosome segregation protein Spo0J